MDGTQQFELHQPLRRRKKAFDAFSNTKETGMAEHTILSSTLAQFNNLRIKLKLNCNI